MANITPQQLRTLDSDPWFGTLPAPVRRDMVERARMVRYRAGERLFLRGDAGDAWYGLMSGSLCASTARSDGTCSVLTFIEPGTWMGDMSLIDERPRTHDVHAYTDAEALRISKSDFDGLFDAHPDLARALLRRRIGTVRLLIDLFEGSMVQPLEQRLAIRLLMLARAFGEPAPRGTRIELRLSQDMLAQMMGVSRPRIHQVVKDWADRGLVERRYGRIAIVDTAGMNATAVGSRTVSD